MRRNIRLIVILVSIFLIISLSRSVVDLWGRRTIVEEEKQRLSDLEKKHEELVRKLEMVQTPAFVEKEARERLGMAREGETIIIVDESFVPGEYSENTGGVPDGSDTLPYWRRWWQVFF